MKSVLITGGTGFIGHYLANELNKRKYNVTVLDIAYNNKDHLDKGVNLILGDIRTNSFSEEYDYVYHLAAKKSVPKSFLHPQDYMSTNIWGTYNIIQSFPKSRIINISSSAAVGGKSIYGSTKKSAEYFANFHKSCVNVRLMNIFGERQLDIDMAVPAFMHSFKYKTTANIWGDGKTTRDYTYVLDVVDELIRIGENKRRGTTEIGYQSPIKIIDLYHLLCRMSKKKPNFKYGPPRKGDVKTTRSKYPIKEPKYGFTEGLRRTARWYLTCKDF